ncbi:MAG: hypothetical protein CPSOU_4582 [uncultured Paraburkholderia sp.]|nr:MAG: hypothetical protein CPSOU_4582 [uncultured Paraburkholderia sp.]
MEIEVIQSCAFMHEGKRRLRAVREIVLQRLHIRPSRIPVAGGVTSKRTAASASGRYPGWRPHAFAFPPAFV